jgi:excisionase family DNA binding protein
MAAEISSPAQTFSVRNAARLLGVGKSTLYDAIARKQIPCIPIGTRKLIPAWWVESALTPPLGVIDVCCSVHPQLALEKSKPRSQPPEVRRR